MRSDGSTSAPLGLKIAAACGLLFLHLPIFLIFIYAFTTEERSFVWPPPGLTTQWFAVTWNRPDVWQSLSLSVRVAAISTLVALVLGTLCAAAVSRTRFFGRETISLLVILADRAARHHHRHRRCVQPFRWPRFRSRSGRSCSATPPSASSLSTTTLSPAFAAPPAR